MLSKAVARFERERAACDEAQFVDVDYRDFVGDPIATTKEIYEAFGLDWTEQTDDAVRTLDAESRQGGRKGA